MKAKVLVADDEDAIRETVARLLSSGPDACDVLSAKDGAQALAVAEREEPDVILLDLDMPGKDGWRVLRELRACARTRTIPVILISGQRRDGAAFADIGLGEDEFLGKPFAGAQLRSMVSRSLRRDRRRSAFDALTRLPGNAAIKEDLSERLRAGTPVAVIVAGIDHFEGYASRCGSERGDELIQETARILNTSLRTWDKRGFLGRLTEAGFALATEPILAPLVARHAARLFDMRLADFYRREDHDPPRPPLVRLSMGIAAAQGGEPGACERALSVAAGIRPSPGSRGSRSDFAFEPR